MTLLANSPIAVFIIALSLLSGAVPGRYSWHQPPCVDATYLRVLARPAFIALLHVMAMDAHVLETRFAGKLTAKSPVRRRPTGLLMLLRAFARWALLSGRSRRTEEPSVAGDSGLLPSGVNVAERLRGTTVRQRRRPSANNAS